MKTHVTDIIDMAFHIGRQSDIEIDKYCEWSDYILPLVEKQFGIRNFPLNLQYSAKKEIQNFIDEKELEFNKSLTEWD